MNFIVTGGAGFIGSHLVRLLLREDHNVAVVDNLSSGNPENMSEVDDKITFYNIDILDYEKLKNAVKNSDGVFHLAGLTNVQESFRKPELYRQVNVVGTENVLKLAKELDYKVVFASSASVYGDVKSIPIHESCKRSPLNPYGQTKLDCEQLCERYSELGVSAVVLRYFNVFGEGQNNAYAGVITKFLENISNKEPPVIHGDGSQVRDFVFVEDVAQANLDAMVSRQGSGFFNIGSGTATSILDLANMMIGLSGLDVRPIHDDKLEGDVKMSQADISLAQSIGWKPKTSLEYWLRQIISSKVTV